MSRSFGGLDASSLPLGLQFQKSAPVVLWCDLHKRSERVVPVFQKCASPGAAGEQMVAFEQNAQSCGIEAQRVAHTAVMDARRALARPVPAFARTRIGIVV